MEGGAVGHNFERDLSIAALLSIKKNELKFNCSYMTMSRLRYILGFSVNFFFQPIDTDYAN
jgi:hypothetical protein